MEGKEYWLSAWENTSKKGNPFTSISVQPKENRYDEVKEVLNSVDDLSDSIPFN